MDLPPLFEILVLVVGAFLAGATNSIAGGGTIITFPLLLALGLPSIQANATSTVALLIGIVGGLFGYRKNLSSARPWLWILAPVSLLGGLLGAWLLTRTDEKLFENLVPFLILFATILFLLGEPIRKLAGFDGENSSAGNLQCAAAAFVQFAVAVYGGYFGAGIGILMLATLAMVGLKNIQEMSAIKTLLGALVNVVASVLFIFSGLVIWKTALIMTIGAGAGYYAGACLVNTIQPRQVRMLVILIGLVLSAVFFWRQFL